MKNAIEQTDYHLHSVEEFKKRLLADLPAVERFVMAIREFCSQKPAQQTTLPCTSCPKSGTPHQPCNRLEVCLDSLHKGKLHRETTIGVNLDELRAQKAAPAQEDAKETARKKSAGHSETSERLGCSTRSGHARRARPGHGIANQRKHPLRMSLNSKP